MRNQKTVADVKTTATVFLSASLLVLGTQLTAFTRAVQPEPTSESPTPGQGHGSPAPRNQSSVCPRLWQRASTSGRQFLGGDSFMTSSSDAPPRGVAPKLCVWVNERRAPWKEALSACRRRNGFLVKLETIIELEGGRGLLEDIRQRGLETVWTGMHHHKGVLLWDELKPSMVTPYFGPTQQYGWKRRHWNFDKKSFLGGRRTCGALAVGDGQSDSRMMEDQPEGSSREVHRAADTRSSMAHSQGSYVGSLIPSARSGLEQRKRRSTLQAPGDPFIPLPPAGDVLGNAATFKVDYEDVANNQSPTQEARIENLQQFLSNQGFQEKYVESIGESPPSNHLQVVNARDDTSQFDMSHIQVTTLSTTKTPDNSNLEDDDYHVVTKREATSPVTAPPVHKLSGGNDAMTTTNTPTSAPKFSQQSSVKGTSLPASTHAQGETTISPLVAQTKSVDDLLNRLLRASLINAQSSLTLQPQSGQIDAGAKASESHQGTLFSESQTKSTSGTDNDDHLRFSHNKPPASPVSETSTTVKPSYSHDQLFSLDMLTPKSKPVLSTENSKSVSKSNQNSSDISSSSFDSNEFLSKEKKNFFENMQTFSQNISPDLVAGIDLTTEAPDDSREVTDNVSSMESTTEFPVSNNTERQSKEYNSREMADPWGSENNTNFLHKNSDNELDLKSNQELPMDAVGVDSAEIFDTASNVTDSTEETSAESNSTTTSTLDERSQVSESEGMSSQNSLQSSMFEEVGAMSAEELSDITGSLLEQLNVDSSGLLQPDASMELDSCQDEHASVCVTEAIEELTLVGHCDRGWFGHRLLDRCYKPVGFKFSEFEARQKCLQRGAVLAMADTEFYSNILALLLQYFHQQRRFNSKIWVDAGLNMAVQADGSCWVLHDASLLQETCARRQSFFCQKDAHFHGFPPELRLDKAEPDSYVHNMTSFHPQTLFCPLRVFAAHDLVIWFKDGRPIKDLEDEEERVAFGFKNGQLSNSLDLDLSILKRVGQGGDRIPKAAMLQGTYWCEVWRRSPRLHRVPSHKIFLKFSDVITLHGHIITEPTNYVEAAMFNSMGLLVGLPVDMERRLATINKNITHQLRAAPLLVRDVIAFIKRVNASDGKAEFLTYICLTTGDLSSHMRRVVIDQYMTNFRQILEQQEAEIKQEWNIVLPMETAVKIFMTDMCPETDLTDKRTGRTANFPSTPINTKAFSTDMCNGVYTGRAWCRGDLETGAYWDNIRVTRSCQGWEWQDASSESEDSDSTWDFDGESSNTDETLDEDDSFLLHKAPNSALLELDEIEIEEENVADVTERLTNVLEDLEELSESDVSAVAQVVDHIVAVRRPPTEVSDKLVQTVSKVMDAAPEVLKKAEEESRALSRLVSDMEKFGEKVDMGSDPVVRHVTPNVAMELWNMEDAGEDVVIGMGATQTASWSAPLSDPRIVTIKNRAWADENLPNFDIAIELPESLVRNTIRYSDTALRLSMFIYRKSSLFVGNDHPDSDRGDLDPMAASGEINSAIISASLGGRRVQGLDEKVRLVFKPLRTPEEEDGWDTRCVFWDDGSKRGSKASRRAHWSRQGCVYNGTCNGRHVCLCDHLTNFAVLLDFYGESRAVAAVHETSLTVVTLVGLSLSIFGLAMTVVTFAAFKKLRQGRAQQTLFNMSISLLCFQLVFLFGVKQTAVWPVCLVVAVLLHYLILVSFAWMLIEAVLQYLTFVKVLGTYISRYTLKTVLPAWGVPLLPVAAILFTDYNLYLGRSDYCWMDLQAFYYAFAVPVGVIIVFNLVMFLVIIASLLTRPKGLRSNQASSKARETNLKAAFTIFILLGLTWMFGFLAIEDARVPFQYAFTVLSSMQGFLIFVLMVVRRRQVRDQWRQLCCVQSDRQPRGQKKLSPVSSSSTSSNNSVSNSRTLPSFINHIYSGGDPDTIVPPYPLPPPALRRQASIHV